MVQTAIKNWWLLALSGIFYAVTSVIYFSYTEHGFILKAPVIFLGKLALAAGACTIAAGIWRSAKGKCWLLMLNGLALGALGLIFNGIFGFKISFRTVALLLAVMAGSIGVFELEIARTLRRLRHVADEWVFSAAGAASFGFALVFLAFVFRWIKLEPGSPAQTLLWLGSYFGFSAICMLGLVLRLHRQSFFQSDQRQDSTPLGI